MRKSKLLSICNLNAAYGQIVALAGIDLEISDGEIVCLLGRNGMGKSTTVKCICGLLKPSDGKIVFKGKNIVGIPSFKVARMGVGLVPEGRRVFTSLTVKENLVGSARPGYWNLEHVTKLFPIFGERLNQQASTLSGGEQQMLSIGRALMTNPSLIILDEATEGLSPIVSDRVWKVLKRIKHEGISILLIDKLSPILTEIADTGFIIEKGKTVWYGQMNKLTNSVARKYLSV